MANGKYRRVTEWASKLFYGKEQMSILRENVKYERMNLFMVETSTPAKFNQTY